MLTSKRQLPTLFFFFKESSTLVTFQTMRTRRYKILRSLQEAYNKLPRYGSERFSRINRSERNPQISISIFLMIGSPLISTALHSIGSAQGFLFISSARYLQCSLIHSLLFIFYSSFKLPFNLCHFCAHTYTKYTAHHIHKLSYSKPGFRAFPLSGCG